MATKEENYMQQITEVIQDDNGTVTATSFSTLAKIKVNEAQNLLDKYAQSEDKISCTYILTGCTDKGISILLSKKNELEEKKATFKTIISQHVYSIQKADLDLITLVNFEPFCGNPPGEPLLGSVVSNKAVKRKLKKKIVVNNTNDVIKLEKQVETKQEKVTENKISKSKTPGIANFCVSGNNATSNSKPVLSNKTKQKNMMTNFFSKSQKVPETNGDTKKELATNDNVRNENIEPNKMPEPMEVDDNELVSKNNSGKISDNNLENEDDKKLKKVIQIDSDNEESIKSKEDKPIEQKKSTIKNENNTTKSKKNKKRKSYSKSDQPSKKRKRIVETQDSDSDIFASSESEIEVVPDIHLSDEESEQNTPKLTQPQKTRRMKQITEEFMDEDGYMNTVQKYVMLSDNEEEEENKEKPSNIEKNVKPTQEKPASDKNEKSPPKKNAKNGKSKAVKVGQNQASIMDFFKKN